MKKRILFFISCLALFSFSVINNNHFTELVNKKLNNYAEENAPEKIYVHIDKPYYALDESIWYSAYLVNGVTHKKSSKSWVVYIELIDGNNNIVATKKQFTNNISVAGDFKINKNWKAGKYLIRAYTNYMRNDNTNHFFQKEITILETKEASTLNKTVDTLGIKPEQLNNVKPDLNFYPEGGYLIDNIRSKIAIKIKNDIYANANLAGIIVDENQNEISKFKITEFGLGAITLSPEPNTTYFAKLELNGLEYSYKLPQALPNGHALSIINLGQYLRIDLKSTIETGLNGTYLVVHQRGKLIYSKYEIENKNASSIKFPVKELKDGVVHITLFNNEGNPVSERLVFISNAKNKANVEIAMGKDVYGKRKEIKINLDVKDSKDVNLPSHLSMSVRDLSLFPYNKRSKNIKTWLLLNSDLRGNIKNPGYFFEKEDDFKRRYLLDLIMMTHGWSRFTWKDLLNEKQKENSFPVERGITISGVTKSLKKPYSAKQSQVKLTFFSNSITQEPIKQTDSLGRFSYGPFVFFDSIQTIIESRLTNFESDELKNRKILIHLEEEKNKAPKIDWKTPLKNKTNSNKQLANFIKMSKYIKQIKTEINEKTQRLEEVTIIARKKEEISQRNKEMNDRTSYGTANNRIDLESDFINNGQTILDLLAVQSGINVNGENITIRGASGPPTILLDDFTVDIDFLNTLDVSNISFIDIFKGADANFIANGSNGAIALYSKRGSAGASSNIKRKPGIIDFSIKGFYTAKEFYAPDHINGIEELTKTDIRTTLHWEPNIKVTENGGQEISFFSSDSKGDYLIEIEGLSESGIPLHAISTFSVN